MSREEELDPDRAGAHLSEVFAQTVKNEEKQGDSQDFGALKSGLAEGPEKQGQAKT